MDYRPELDGIRAAAVLAVVAFHSYVTPLMGGWLGVDVFFVLSGYLITSVLLAEFRRTGAIDLRQFWVRRLLRLVPALLAALVLGAFFFSSLGDDGTLLGYVRSAGAAGLYVENFVWVFTGNEFGKLGHTWSLAVEMQFYLVWPLAMSVLLSGRRRLVPWVLGATAVSFGLFVVQTQQIVDDAFPASYYLPWTRAFELLVGALVAIVLAQRPRAVPDTDTPKGRWVGWLIGVALGLVLLVSAFLWIGTMPEMMLWQAPAVTLLTAALLVHLDRVRTAGVGALLSWRPAVWIGKVSYAIYLFHYPVTIVLRENTAISDGKELFVTTTAISCALAALSWTYVERPALRLKRRNTGRSSAPDDAAAVGA